MSSVNSCNVLSIFSVKVEGTRQYHVSTYFGEINTLIFTGHYEVFLFKDIPFKSAYIHINL